MLAAAMGAVLVDRMSIAATLIGGAAFQVLASFTVGNGSLGQTDASWLL